VNVVLEGTAKLFKLFLGLIHINIVKKNERKTRQEVLTGKIPMIHFCSDSMPQSRYYAGSVFGWDIWAEFAGNNIFPS